MVLNIFLCSLKHFRLFVFYLLLLPSELAKKIYSMVVPLSTTRRAGAVVGRLNGQPFAVEKGSAAVELRLLVDHSVITPS